MSTTLFGVFLCFIGGLPPTGTDRFEWTCSFEDNNNRPTMCGITQDEDDEFDWTMQNGRTPSGNTGPSAALNGKYYVFIEASDPRKRDDDAVYVKCYLVISWNRSLIKP